VIKVSQSAWAPANRRGPLFVNWVHHWMDKA
jgi:hypothetical protein